MQLRTNGPVVSAYRWLYGISEAKLKNNFCPIFWMMVLGVILIVPYFLFCIPAVLYELYNKNYQNGDHSFGVRLGMSIFTYVGMFILFAIGQFGLFLLGYYNFKYGAVMPGMLFLIAIIIGVIINYGVDFTSKRKRKNREARCDAITRGETIPDSLGTVIINIWSSFYDKHCPRITWIRPHESK